jgi:hypothetical protein
MLLEAVQILSTVAHLKGGTAPYKKTHEKHPSVIWAAASYANFEWLKKYVDEMNIEWKYRFNHDVDHKSYVAMQKIICEFDDIGLTPFALAMPTYCRDGDAVVAYRKYYLAEKSHLARWTKREIPYWWKK